MIDQPNFVKVLFFAFLNDTDFILRSSVNDYDFILNFYRKLVYNPNGNQYKTTDPNVKKILLNGGKIKLLCVAELKYNSTREKLFHFIKCYFDSIEKVKQCKEYQFPPVKEPMGGPDEIMLGDIIVIDGVKYIELEDGTRLTFEQVEKKYKLTTDFVEYSSTQ